jgi:hypothetical protein
MTPRRIEFAVVGLLAAVATAVFLAAPTYPNYDSYYHLVWGRELVDGTTPSFDAYQAPTEHPLFLALAAVLALFGEGADRALVAVCVVALVATIWGVYRVGAAVFGMWPALAGALFAGSSFTLALYTARAYVDVPYLALVFWAAALEVRSPRRGTPVMVLLSLAGLLRPEAWVLAAAYWLWCRPGLEGAGARVRLAAIAMAAPVAWALVDLVVTGDALHSLHATSDLADELDRRRDLGSLPADFVRFVADLARTPVAIAGGIGLALALAASARRLGPLARPRELAVPLAMLGAGALTFLATGVAGLAILPRYLTVPAVTLCLFAGYALLGFTMAGAGGARRRWAVASAVAAVLGAGAVAARAPSPDRLTTELRFVERVHADLEDVLAEPPVLAGLRCGPLTLPTYRLVPDARWILDAPRERVGARSARRRPYGVALFVLGERALRRFGFAAGTSPLVNVPDPGYAPVARNRTFSAYVSCPGR